MFGLNKVTRRQQYLPNSGVMSEEWKRSSSHLSSSKSALFSSHSTSRIRHKVTFLALLALALFALYTACDSFWSKSASEGKTELSGRRERGKKDVQYEVPYFHNQENGKGMTTSDSINSTLNFEHIFVLNLGRRIDRRDTMRLMGLASNLQLDFWTGQDGWDASKAALPPVNLLPGLKALSFAFTQGQLGCYRSNLDILSHIVDQRISTALILQDDAEWDVDLRWQLSALREPLSILLQHDKRNKFTSSNSKTLSNSSPWFHQAWDILWLGPSYEHGWPIAEEAPYVMYPDKTVADGDMAEPGGDSVFANYNLQRSYNSNVERVRLVQQSRQPLGMVAYAVTLAGASRILARAGQKIEQPYDSTVCAMSRPKDPRGYRDQACVNTDYSDDDQQREQEEEQEEEEEQHKDNETDDEKEDEAENDGEKESFAASKGQDSLLRSYSVWPPLFSQFRGKDGKRDSDLTSNRPVGPLVADSKVGYALEIRNGVRQKILLGSWPWT